MKKLFFLLLLPVASFAQNAEKSFKLNGDLKLSKPIDWVYLRYSAGENFVTDSFQAPKGQFKYEGKIAEPTVANLMVKYVKQDGEEKPQRESLQLFLVPGKLELVAKDSLKTGELKGSEAQKDLASIQKDQQSYSDRLTPLYTEYSKLRKQGDKEGLKKIEQEIEAIDLEMKENVFGTFVKNNPGSPIALYALKQYAGWDLDAAKVDPLYASLSADIKSWPSAVQFGQLLEIARKTSIGQYAMDFVQNDTLDKAVALSSFRGKYVLVDFWASWCGPCRADNPNIVKAFNRFKDKNFTILGVSLDRAGQKERWMKAIHDDNLTWTHVSDLKFWDNAAAKQYGIRAIPQNLLLDPAGKIIAKNLDGEKLEVKLGEVLK
jgi:peroxiredoxin